MTDGWRATVRRRTTELVDELAGLDGARGQQAAMAWIAMLLGCLTVLVAAIQPPFPTFSFLVLLAFTCFGPGAAFVSLIRFGDWASSSALALVLSLALAGGTANVMLWTDEWHPLLAYTLLATPTVAVAALVLLTDPRRVRPQGTPSPGQSSDPAQPDDPAQAARLAILPAQAGQPAMELDVTTVIPRFALASPSVPRGDETTMLALPATITDDAPTRRIPAQRIPTPQRIPEPRRPSPLETSTEPGPANLPARSFLRPLGALAVEGAFAATILGLWIYSMAHTDATSVGDYGLLATLHPAFIVAVAACVLRFTWELSRERFSGWILNGYTLLLIVLMHATVPLLVHEPEYAWSYKHVGVVELFIEHGHITHSRDLYQQWPTFFATVAHLVAGSGIDSLRVAAWAPVFFDIAFCVPLFAVARTLCSDRRAPYLTVFIFTAVNWVAQDYLSPQAFTYILSLGTLLIMLRWLRRTTSVGGAAMPSVAAPPATWRGRVHRLWSWVGRGLAEVPYTATYARRAAMVALYVVYAMVVASHQLSPYVIAMSAGALVLLGLVRPLRIVPILLVIAIVYLLPRYQIADNYGLFDGFNFLSNARSAGPVLGTTAARVFSAHVVQFLSLVVWGLGALAVVSSLRRPGPVAAPAVLAFSPFALLLAQSYGGEAIYRVYLFSLPWFALLIATLVLRRRWLPKIAAVAGAAVALTLAVLACMQGAHGQLSFNQFSRAEVQAARYLYEHAEPGADILVAAGNFPTRLTANYTDFAAGPNSDHSLVTGSNDLAGLPLTQADLPTINAHIDPTVPSYLVFSPAMSRFLHYFGYLPDGVFDTLRATIAASPNWREYYRDGDVVIYKYVP